MGIGTTALFILIGIGFALYVGGNAVGLCSPGICAPGFALLFLNIGSISLEGLINMALAPIAGIIGGISMLAAAVVGASSGKGWGYILGYAVMVYLANLLLLPMNFLPSVAGMFSGTLMPLYWLISIVFNLLLLLAVLGFVLEKDF